eukprot:gene4022-100_t
MASEDDLEPTSHFEAEGSRLLGGEAPTLSKLSQAHADAVDLKPGFTLSGYSPPSEVEISCSAVSNPTPLPHISLCLYHATAFLVDPAKGGGILSSVFNLTMTVIGAGIMALPFAFRNCGLALGFILMVVVYSLVTYSCRLLVLAGEIVPCGTFRNMASAALGVWGGRITDLGTVISTAGAMTGYLTIVGDVITPLLLCAPEPINSLGDRRIIISLSLLVVMPLSLLPRINFLKYSSFLALGALLYLVVVVVVRATPQLNVFGGCWAWSNDEEECNATFVETEVKLFMSLPIIIQSFSCQINIFPLVGELRKPTRHRSMAFIHMALTLCLVVYVIVSSFGYLTFYTKVQGNILLNYELNDELVQIGRVAMGAAVLLSFPLQCHPNVNTVCSAVFGTQHSPAFWKRSIVAIMVVLVVYGIAMVVEDVSIILAFAGSTGSTTLAFILPPLIYIGLQKHPIYSRPNTLPLVLLTLGLCFFGLGLSTTLWKVSDGISNDIELETCFITPVPLPP